MEFGNTFATLLLFHLPNIYGTCRKSNFEKLDGKYYTANVLLNLTDRIIHKDDCQRACRMDFQCFAYQFVWTDSGSNLGYCETIGHTGNGISQMQTNNDYTLFVSCPDPLEFFGAAGSCYALIETHMKWDDAWAHCKTLHPDAHLMDINSQAEQDVAAIIAVAFGSVWLGGKRFGTEVDDFVWVHDNTNINASAYTNWKIHQPTSPRDLIEPADCVKIKYGNKWFDSRCEKDMKFLCEF